MCVIFLDRCRVVQIPIVRMVKFKFLTNLPFYYYYYHFYYYYYYSLRVFLRQSSLIVLNWSLSDRKSPQDSRTFLRILADLSNAVVWMVSTHPFISKSSSPFFNHLVTVQRAPIIISIIVTFIFHSFFQFPSKVEVFIFLFTFF